MDVWQPFDWAEDATEATGAVMANAASDAAAL
jgi:hypothetical protein